MASYPHIDQYREELSELIEFGGSDSELNIRPAFQNCLAAYCRDHRERLLLVPELAIGSRNRPDGTVKDSLRMARGYWEAKDTHDDLDAEIQAKFNRGYPQDNILFEDSQTAVLYQNGSMIMRVDMSRPRELDWIINQFLDYELPEIWEFRRAREQFRADLPWVLEALREAVADAEANNAEYHAAADVFLTLCHRTIGPWVSPEQVREMLLQHILTKDIFLRVFAEDQFHQENNIAVQLDALERTFFTGNLRRQAIDRLRAYYGAIGRAADEIADYAEKQQFLKAIYEDFYQAYNPEAADRLGVVYTPNEVVDFIIRGADWLLDKRFGKSLAHDRINILDPATGTGTFITNLINYLPADRLEHKYRNEIYANEVAILPYYIANLNIEYTYKERTGQYLEFPNLCFVDTLDNMDWQGTSADTFTGRLDLHFGGISQENWMRLQEQNEQTISVIIGNPPYNASATLWDDGTANDPYPDVDRRISDTYIANSSAQKTKQYDMYKRFIRWASDRLAEDGIIGFVSNNAFLDARQDDGFRKVVAEEFNELWAIDLKGNARTIGEQRRREGGNVFDDKIRVGVAVYFLVRRKGADGFKVFYNAVDDYARSFEKLAYVRNKSMDGFDFLEITPDAYAQWLNQSNSNFGSLVPLADRETKFAKTVEEEQAMFKLSTPGVNTARDGWVYDFSADNLRSKYLFFADTYNGFLDEDDKSYNPVIKWSRDLRNEFQRGHRIVYSEANRIQSLYRPFVIKHHFADFTMNDVLTSNHYDIFGLDLKQPNQVINFSMNGRHFYVLAASRLTDWHFTGDTQCLPLYRYAPDDQRVSNITQWGLQRINDHYREQWGDHFDATYPDGITAEDVFAYTYAVLHDPVYRHDYQVDLLREFPRLPLYHDFDAWAKMGQQLLDLHIGFESAEPYPLERHDRPSPKPYKTRLLANTSGGVITLDDGTTVTTLAGIPEATWRYRLGSRSALEWVLDQYKEKKPRDPTIRERFNTYRFADYKEPVIDLLQRVCTVSVKTMAIVDGMAYWEDGHLIVFDDRGKNEWETMALEAFNSYYDESDDDPEYQAWLASLPDIREQKD
ncbi:MAG: N-6 DNA methylase [Chloroflexi bacterium]|nr:N-6 DNA methylase [Chloroflexota bacterium]MYD49345.1 N-6 DNA methylase [Chloroflexota bacterium]